VICWSVNDSKWNYWLVHIIPFAGIRQNAGGTRYRCEGGAFSPELATISVQIEGAIVKEQGVTFAIVIVKPHVLKNSSEANKIQFSCTKYFPGMPIILMAQDSRGVPTYYGRKDIVDFLANIPTSCIPWKRYTFSD
jgi:hypothetical protein